MLGEEGYYDWCEDLQQLVGMVVVELGGLGQVGFYFLLVVVEDVVEDVGIVVGGVIVIVIVVQY